MKQSLWSLLRDLLRGLRACSASSSARRAAIGGSLACAAPLFFAGLGWSLQEDSPAQQDPPASGGSTEDGQESPPQADPEAPPGSGDPQGDPAAGPDEAKPDQTEVDQTEVDQAEADQPAGGPPGEEEEATEQPFGWLDQLVLETKGRVQVESVGRGRDGESLRLVTLLPVTGGEMGEAREVPALVLCGDSPRHRELLTTLALPGDDSVRALADSVEVYFFPQVGSAFASEGGVLFAHDFPVGWFPSPLRAGAGEVPLTRADSQALSQLLQNQRNVVALLLPEVSAAEHAAPTGCPQGYAWHAFGVPSLQVLPAADGLLAPVEAVPRLATRVLEVASLGEGQWRVDVELRNLGRLPTFSETAQRLRGAEGLHLRVSGGRVVAAASAEPEQSFALARGRSDGEDWRLALAPLEGGAARVVRLIVEAPEGAELLATADGAWTRGVRLAVPLIP